MRKLLNWIKWIFKGKPMVEYNGFNCGCCGKWVRKNFQVPKYLADRWGDTWGLCEKCVSKSIDYAK